MRTASPPARGSKILILRSREVVAKSVPDGLNAMLWIASPWPDRTDLAFSGFARSHNLTVCSPVVVASTCSAVGWKSTCPTLRGVTSILATGSKSCGSQCSSPQPSNTDDSTFHIMALPSSPADATIESLNGDQSVSRTGALWLRARGMISGSLNGVPWVEDVNGEGRGRIAKAPPPEAFQLMLMYLFWCNVRRRDIALISHCGTHSRGSNKIGVPCTVRDLQIFVAIFFLARLTVDVSIASEYVVRALASLSSLPVFRWTHKARHVHNPISRYERSEKAEREPNGTLGEGMVVDAWSTR